MEITDRTLEDVIIQAIESGKLAWILIIGLIVGFLLGLGLASLYFSKFRYVVLTNNLETEKEDRMRIQTELDMLNNKYSQLLSDVQKADTRLYAYYATQKDESDQAVMSLLNKG